MHHPKRVLGGMLVLLVAGSVGFWLVGHTNSRVQAVHASHALYTFRPTEVPVEISLLQNLALPEAGFFEYEFDSNVNLGVQRYLRARANITLNGTHVRTLNYIEPQEGDAEGRNTLTWHSALVAAGTTTTVNLTATGDYGDWNFMVRYSNAEIQAEVQAILNQLYAHILWAVGCFVVGLVGALLATRDLLKTRRTQRARRIAKRRTPADRRHAKITRNTNALRKEPQNALAWANLGILFHMAGQAGEELFCRQRALALGKDTKTARQRVQTLLDAGVHPLAPPGVPAELPFSPEERPFETD